VITLARENAEGGIFDANLVSFDRSALELGHAASVKNERLFFLKEQN